MLRRLWAVQIREAASQPALCPPVSQSIMCLTLSPSIPPSIHLSSLYPSIHSPIHHLPVCLSINVSINQWAHLLSIIYLSTHSYIHPFTQQIFIECPFPARPHASRTPGT